MSAGQEISINKLGIISGSGTLPRDLYQQATAMGIECHIIGFKGHTNYITPDFWGNVTQASNIINYLKKNNIHDLVFIGGISRPSVFQLRFDWLALKFFVKAFIKSFGDSSLLNAARQELEKMGFHLHGVHEFLPELIMQEGLLGDTDIQYTPYEDIILGVNEALAWGLADKGQAVIVKDGQIIAREDKSGTNWMINRYACENSTLIKMCKPQQDRDLDLPTIGPETVQLCIHKKMAGIVGHAGHMLIADRQRVIELADKHGLYILGHVDEKA